MSRPLDSRRLYEQLFTSAPLAVAFLDRDLRYIRVNDAMARANGAPAGAHVGRTVVEMTAGLADELVARYRRVLADGRPIVDQEVEQTDADGRRRIWLAGSFPVLDDDGAVAGICTVAQDITEHSRVRESLEVQLRFQSLMARVSGTLLATSSGDLDRTLKRSLPDIAGFFGAERVTVWEQDRENERLRPCAVWSLEGVGSLSMDLTSDDFPDTAERVLAGDPVFFEADEQSPGLGEGPSRTYLHQQRLRSSILVPVMAAGKVAVVLAMGTVTRRAGWNDDDLQRARVVAGVLASALKRRDTEQELADAFDRIAQLKDRLEEEYTVLREEISLHHHHEEIIGAAPSLREILYRAEQVAETDVTVLIHGETGTGKELVARAVHRASRRHSQPLVTVNCAALPPTLIESELFGHERGAFTGADARRAGRFEIAHGGTLFLDEVGELPLDLQAKLLRVLQLGEFERLGSSRTQKADVRIIAATNRDLEAEVAAGRFREDLWYRLNVFPLRVPPLRERREDIPALTAFFLDRLGAKLGRPRLRLPRTVLEALQAYPWPGNVRELENVIERGVITSTGSEFRLADPLTRGPRSAERTLRPLAHVERDHLEQVLNATNWRIEGPGGAAEVLDLNPSTLRSRLRKHGLRRPRRSSEP